MEDVVRKYGHFKQPCISGFAFVTDDVAEMLKKCNIFSHMMDSPGGLLPRDLHV